MAELTQNPIQYPWQLFLEAQRMKNANQQQMYSDIAGIGQGFGNIGQTLEKQQAQKTVAAALEAMRTGKIPTAGINNVGVPPSIGIPGQQTAMAGVDETQMNMAPQAQPPQAPAMSQGLMKALMTLNPQLGEKMLAGNFDPLVQSQIAENYSQAAHKAQENKSMQDVYKGPNGEYSTTPKEGYTLAGKVPLAQAYQYEKAGELAGTKMGFAKEKEVKKQWNDLQKTVNPFRSQGIGGSASTFNKAAIANQAAARGLKILNKPSLTWQELNAYVNTDIASIQRGGTPTDIQLHESNYNTLSGKLGAFKTFVSGKPSAGLVPRETVDQVRQNIMDIIGVDNQIIDDGIDYAEQAYPDAVSAFPSRWKKIKEQAQKIKTVGQDEGTKLGTNKDVSAMSDDELRKLAAGAK